MRFRYAYVVDGAVLATDAFDTTHTCPQAFADAIASMPADPPFDTATVHVWRDWRASTDTTPDAVAS